MSLLFNQDYALHQVRTRYLASMKDGIGERLINLNQNVFNVPGYKIAGWPRPAEIENYTRRAYSPPIPAGGSTDYFAGLPRSAALERSKLALEEDELEDDSKTIGRGATVGSHGSLRNFHRQSEQNRSLSQAEDEDSSDLTDESDLDDDTVGRTQHIKFPKLPVRQRAGSSPTHYANHANPRLLVTSPGKSSRTRSGSHGMIEYERSRGLSTGNDDELNLLSHRIDEDTQAFKQLAQKLRASPATSFRNQNELDFDSDEDLEDEDDDDDDDASTISSDFAGPGAANANMLSSSSNTPPPIAPLFAAQTSKSPAPLAPLPPPRPISQIQPVSLLTQLIKANQEEISHPLDVYTQFSGKGDMKATGPVLRRFGQSTDTSAPLRLRVYCPFSTEPLKYLEVIVKRSIIADGIKQETVVADTLGYILYRYREEDRQPPLTEEQYNVNKWSLHIMDEPGEPDEDFPPLDRTRAISAYQLEDLVLVEAPQAQFEENERLFPSAKVVEEPKKPASPAPTSSPQPFRIDPTPVKPADAPIIINQSGTRTGASTHLKIFCNTPEVHDQSVVIRITSDTYIGEVLDIICKKKHLDSTRHILRILGTSIIVPLDRLKRITKHVESTTTTLLSQSITATDVLSSAGYQKFTVWRKMPMSFISRHERVLAIDGEYVHIMPSDQNKTLFDSPKTYISSSYAFEATSQEQAAEIVDALRKQMSAYKMDKDQ
ncbi:hypothetical protein Dda_1799 [Drechslerella dactyloides]|uniref:Uncharacterized protein n=1 Tax=Drechslerella dactyloides TaxID=74499 RepID=A0AAD6J2K7_DREDA|nr:hypothetical protein Dda_1799 [Drechslerella dactyloides]